MKVGVGERIGVWVVQQALGRGGMGTVYRCHHVETPRLQAAVKVLGEGLHRPSEAQVRFIREAEILGGLDHPHIVRVRGLRMDVHPPFIEMDFVDGIALDKVLRQGPVDVDRALTWMTQLVAALAYLHDRGVRHRDVKPGNVVVTDDDKVVLVDFGLATDADLERITQEGLSFGTVSYAPPEWMDPERLDAAHWDLYAVGVIFYELLTGTVAFPLSGKGPVRKQLLQVAMSKQKAPPLDPGEDVPDGVRAIIRRVTQKKIEDRYADAHELLAALEGAKRGEVAVEEPKPMRWWPWAALAAASVGVGIALGWSLLPSETVESEPSRPARLDPEVAPPMAGEVRITGTSGAQVRLAEQQGSLGDEPLLLSEVPGGPQVVSWVIGEGCEACFDGDCSSRCGHGDIQVEVEAGGAVDVALPEVPRVAVRFEAPEVAAARTGVFKKKEWPVKMRLGDRTLRGAGPGAAKGYATPGVHELVVEVGSCSPDEVGCLPDSCTSKCTSLVRRVTVPWEGSVDLELRIPPPR